MRRLCRCEPRRDVVAVALLAPDMPTLHDEHQSRISCCSWRRRGSRKSWVGPSGPRRRATRRRSVPAVAPPKPPDEYDNRRLLPKNARPKQRSASRNARPDRRRKAHSPRSSNLVKAPRVRVVANTDITSSPTRSFPSSRLPSPFHKRTNRQMA